MGDKTGFLLVAYRSRPAPASKAKEAITKKLSASELFACSLQAV